jgi:diadenosine tetraphosphate (Ap4A) HIT family hydrolase
MDCPHCLLNASDQEVVLRDDLVWFVRNHRYQGSLKHSGVIIPVAHRETVFDLTESEVAATFRLAHRVKAWMDAEFSPDGYNVGWNCGARWRPRTLPCPPACHSKI